MKKQKKNRYKEKRYEGYQIGDGRQVSEITEEEAKIELAKAIDVIEKLAYYAQASNDYYEKWSFDDTE